MLPPAGDSFGTLEDPSPAETNQARGGPSHPAPNPRATMPREDQGPRHGARTGRLTASRAGVGA